jgi:hypothetical protein
MCLTLSSSHKLNIIVPSLIRRWKRFKSGSELSAEAFVTLSKRFKDQTKGWLKADNAAQKTRHRKPEAMDIYDTAKEKGVRIELFLRSNPHPRVY